MSLTHRIGLVALVGLLLPPEAMAQQAGGSAEPTASESASAGAKTQKKGRRQLFKFLEGDTVRGEVQKPELSYVIIRQGTVDQKAPSLQTTFIPDLVGSVDSEPF